MTDVEQLWRTFRAPLMDFLRNRIREDNDVEDILSEVFLKLQEKINDLEEIEDPRAWLYQVTRNAVIDHYRQRDAGSKSEDLYDLPAEPSGTQTEDLKRCVGSLLDSLQSSDQEALLAIAKGRSQEQYARDVGLSSTGARSRVQRARSRLKDAFTTCCRIEFDGTGKVFDWHRHGSRDDCEPDCRSDC